MVLDFIAKMTGALAWPVAVVVLGVLYRSSLQNILDGEAYKEGFRQGRDGAADVLKHLQKTAYNEDEVGLFVVIENVIRDALPDAGESKEIK